MCSLCGVLGERGHWADTPSSPEVFAARSHSHTWQRERQERMRLVNRVLSAYKLTAAAWASNDYVLRSPTGRTAIVSNLTALWAAAEELAGRPIDPLDAALLEHLDPGGTGAG